MKLFDILREGKFSKERIYGYHGTHIRHLRSIIKKGLVQQHHKGFGSGIHSALYYSLDPLGGIYFTNNYKEAKTISSDIKPYNSPPLVIVAQINPKSIMADDDYAESFLTLFSRNNHLMDDQYQSLERQIRNTEEDEREQKINEFVKRHHDTTVKELHKKLLESGISNKTQEHLVSKLKPVLHEYINILVRNVIRKYPKDITSIVNDMRDTIRKLIKHVHQKALVGQVKDMRTVRFAVDQDRITFSGANRIVGIILPSHNVYWGDPGIPAKRMQQVSTPMELLAYYEDENEKV